MEPETIGGYPPSSMRLLWEALNSPPEMLDGYKVRTRRILVNASGNLMVEFSSESVLNREDYL